MPEANSDEVAVLEIALKVLSTRFDEFVSACLDAEGKPAAPARKDVMRARACLPPYCKYALTNKS